MTAHLRSRWVLAVSAVTVAFMLGAGAWAFSSAGDPSTSASDDAPVTGLARAAIYEGPEASPDREASGAEVEGAVVLEKGGPTISLEEADDELSSGPSEPEVDPATDCWNSVDPACGPFLWTPAVVNQPVEVFVEVTNDEPAAGEPFQLRLHWSDPDADSATANVRMCDEANYWCIEVLPSVVCRGTGPTGRWAAPPSRPGSGHFDVEVTLPSVGIWTLVASVSTHASWYPAWAQDFPCGAPPDPYASTAEIQRPFRVTRLASA